MQSTASSSENAGEDILPQSVSVVLPAHNEVDIIGVVLRSIAATLDSGGLLFEVLVVDDGSTDGTAEVLANESSTMPQLRVIKHSRKRGYGAAIRTGLCEARFPVTVVMDSDGQYSAADILPALALLSGVDCVLGVRVERADGLYRRFVSVVGRQLSRSFLPMRVFDVNCGFKVFRTEDLRRMTLHSSGGFIYTEVLRRLGETDPRIRQLTVDHRPRQSGSATGGSPRVIVGIVRDACREVRHRTTR